MRKIGIISDSFRRELREGIQKAAECGAQGIQLYAVSGPMAPDNLDAYARKDLKDYIISQGLEVSAICGDLGGHGFTVEKENPYKIETSKKIMDLALDLGGSIVTTHIGVIPSEPDHPRYQILKKACEELGDYADSVGAYFAIETGPEKAETLKTFLESLHSKGVRVNYDPANLLMVTGDDPVKGIHILKDYIVHTHAKDGVMLKQTDPQLIYDFFAEGGIGDLRLEDYFMEMPLGKGHVDFAAYFNALDEIGYDGYLTIEREVGENPEKDIREAVLYLQQYGV